MFKLDKKRSWKFLAVVWLVILGAIVVVQIISINLDNRSKADEAVKNVDVSVEGGQNNGFCGSVNGSSVSSRPVSDLCANGTSVIWLDSVADYGSYSWSCVGSDGKKDDCFAFLEVNL